MTTHRVIWLSRVNAIVYLSPFDFRPGRMDLPAQTEVQREVGAYAPIILHKRAEDGGALAPNLQTRGGAAVCNELPFVIHHSQIEIGIGRAGIVSSHAVTSQEAR